MDIFVGIPTIDGKVCAETAQALLAEQVVLALKGHRLTTGFTVGCSLITHARNDVCANFLASGADILVFIDADIGWEPGAVLKLVETGEDVVGGAYPYKKAEEGYPVAWLGNTAEPGPNGLIAVGALPGGFLAVTRAALERIAEAEPARVYTWGGKQLYAYFEAPFIDGRLYGEDVYFCASWRHVGGKVWLRPDLVLTHVGGVNSYTGCVGDWLAEGPMAQGGGISVAA